MSIVLELPFEVEQRLEQLAQSQGRSVTEYLTRIVESLVPPLEQEAEPVMKKVTLLARRNIELDQRLLDLLEQRLQAQGYRTFTDRHLTVGVEWAQELERQIRDADAVILFLSEAALHSEMLLYEAECAYQTYKEKQTPQIIGIRVNYEKALPAEYEVFHAITVLNWQTSYDDERLVYDVIETLAAH